MWQELEVCMELVYSCSTVNIGGMVHTRGIVLNPGSALFALLKEGLCQRRAEDYMHRLMYNVHVCMQ